MYTYIHDHLNLELRPDTVTHTLDMKFTFSSTEHFCHRRGAGTDVHDGAVAAGDRHSRGGGHGGSAQSLPCYIARVDAH